jgi:predicted nucleotidyltransferase
MRSFRDRDFLQTNEGFFFCVVGSVHPPNRVVSYIKYVPSESGIWAKGGKKFSRILQKYTIPNLLETFSYIEQNYPHYLFHSPVDNITITAVSHQNIKEHFKPEQKLAQLRQAQQLDLLQKKLIKFTQFLKQTSGVPEEDFGVTGSLLLDIHNATFSDIDLTVYGIKNSWALRDALTKASTDASMKRLTGKTLTDWCIKKSQHYPLTPKEALKLYKRKWNLGFFENTWVSIHPIKLENEITEKYGQRSYSPCGQVTIHAVVSGNTESLFLPAVYQINDVNVLEGTKQDLITEVVSYETLYSSLAEKGETIQVKGKLEKVTEKQNSKQHYRVLVGSAEGKGKEYIKLVE